MTISKEKLCCPLTGCYIPRLLVCAVVGFGFIFIYDYILHNKILMDVYAQTSDLWRTPEEMQSHYTFMLLVNFLIAFLTAAIYGKGHEGKGIAEGLRFGLLIGLFIGVMNAAAYTWLPISSGLAQAWFLGGLVKGLGLGILYSLIYKPASCG